MFIIERSTLKINAVFITYGDIATKFLAIIKAIRKRIITRPNGHIRSPYSFPTICLNHSLLLPNIPRGRKLKSTDVLKIWNM